MISGLNKSIKFVSTIKLELYFIYCLEFVINIRFDLLIY